MKIENENYVLEYNEVTHQVMLSGSLRLNGLDEYALIFDVLKQCLNNAKKMSLDLCQLEFLNSSGIAMLSKFIIEARGTAKENQQLEICIIGSKLIPWQGKSLKNLQRLFPAMQVVIN
ncbi:MAG: hypothetical protein QM479_05615 [Pseudomonadota bacterium]